MMYLVTYRRDNKDEAHTVTHAQMMALTSYLKNTYRITADVQPMTKMGADK